MSEPRLLAIDWGTTNRRVFVLDGNGSLLATERDERGLIALRERPAEAFAAAAAATRKRFGDLPMLCAGMVGSKGGWREAPYQSAPAGLEQLAAGLTWIERGHTAIVPGVCTASPAPPDVMRGEEVQLLGAVELGAVPPDALLCQPGTHCKWARLENGRIAGFHTAMNGELFAMLRRDSLLADFLTHPVIIGDAFDAGLEAARAGNLAQSLFGARAAVLLGQRSAEETASYVSGLLLGSDALSHPVSEPGQPVYLLADATLAAAYVRAIEHAGATPVTIDSHAAFIAGINAIWRLADVR